MQGIKKHTHSKHHVTIENDTLKKALGLPKKAVIEFCALYAGSVRAVWDHKTDKIIKKSQALHSFTYTIEEE
jgi:hypothetical protein